MKTLSHGVPPNRHYLNHLVVTLAAVALFGQGASARATAQTAAYYREEPFPTAGVFDLSKGKVIIAKPSPIPSGSPTILATNLLVSFDEWWRYNDSGVDLGTDWRAPGHDDVNWLAGPGLLGYETAPLPFPILTPLADRRSVVTRYFRTRFNFADDPSASELRLRAVVDDGAVFYLNGAEVLRLGMPDGVPVLYATQPSRAVGDATIEGPFEIVVSSLVRGENVLAVELHQAGTASTDAVFGAELQAVVATSQPLPLSDRLPRITSQPRNLTVQVGSPAMFNVVAVDATNVPPVSRAGSTRDRFVYRTGTPRGTLSLRYDFSLIPDRMQVFYEGTELFDTGWFSDNTTTLVPFGPGAASQVEIVTNEDIALFGSIWDYTASTLRPALTYQWRRNGVDIPGATNDTLSIPPAQFSDVGRYSVVVANASGSRLSVEALLTVQQEGVAPVVTSITPLNQTVLRDSSTAITVTATGTEPLAYRWRHNGNSLFGETNRTITFTHALTNHAGAFTCVVTNLYGRATSAVSTLTVTLPGPDTGPPIITFPRPLFPGLPAVYVGTFPLGTTVQIFVMASGAPPLSYHWHFNGPTQPLSGEETGLITLENVEPAQAGTYTVVVSNAFGTATLDAVLNVLVPGSGSLIEFASASFPFTNGRVFDVSGTNQLPGGASILAQLDVGTTATNLQPLGGTAGFLPGGRIAGGPRRWRGVVPGQTVFARVRCWAAAFGPSYVQALDAGGPVGESIIFPIELPSVATVAAQLTNLPSFSMVAGLPPEIISQPQPQSLTVTQGMFASFSVFAQGSGPRTYQWRFENADIPGARGAVLFMPAAQPAQSGRYSVRVANAHGAVDSVEAMLIVVSTNLPPIAFGQTVSLLEDSTAAISLMASDPNGDTLRYTVNPPQFGVLNGTPPDLVYQPSLDYFGPDSFTFTVSDGALASSVATIRLNIQPVNDPPTASAQSITVNEDSSVAITLMAVDVEREALTYSVTPPEHGTLNGVAPNLIYRPAADYHGPDRFTFSVNDSQVSSPAAEVAITVVSVNDQPVAVATVSPRVILTPGNTNWIVLSPNGSNAQVIFDATHSFDTENDPLQYVWIEGDPGAVLGGGARSTNTFSAGEHTVVLLADDGTDTGAGEFTFTVLSPGEAVGEIALMLDQSTMPRQAIRPLLATLQASIASLDRGNWTAGENQLHAFLNKIRAQVAPYEPQLATDLTAAVELLLEMIGK